MSKQINELDTSVLLDFMTFHNLFFGFCVKNIPKDFTNFQAFLCQMVSFNTETSGDIKYLALFFI